MADIRAHPWFAGIDWDTLDSKSAKAPFVPDPNRNNFDVAHELDEFMMAEKPLSHKQRKEGGDPEKRSPELRELETQYVTVFFFIRAITCRF
jgi:serine/threonine kinase 32